MQLDQEEWWGRVEDTGQNEEAPCSTPRLNNALVCSPRFTRTAGILAGFLLVFSLAGGAESGQPAELVVEPDLLAKLQTLSEGFATRSFCASRES